MDDPGSSNPSEDQTQLMTTTEMLLLDRSNSPMMPFFPVLPFTSISTSTDNEAHMVNPEESPDVSDISHTNTVTGVNEGKEAFELAHADESAINTMLLHFTFSSHISPSPITDQSDAVELAAMPSTEDLAAEEPVVPPQEMESDEKSSPMYTPTTTSSDAEEIMARDALIASALDPVETEKVPPAHPPVAIEGERARR